MKNAKAKSIFLATLLFVSNCGFGYNTNQNCNHIDAVELQVAEEVRHGLVVADVLMSTRPRKVETEIPKVTTVSQVTTLTTTLASTTTSTVITSESEDYSECEAEEDIEEVLVDTTMVETYEDTEESEEDEVDGDLDVDSDCSQSDWCVTDYERELLAEIVEHEAGSSWISCYDKACCVAAVMNRVRQGCWGGYDVYSVLAAPGQFSGFYPGYVSPQSGAYEAVDYYFAHPEEFSSYITSWCGDGYQNYFS